MASRRKTHAPPHPASIRNDTVQWADFALGLLDGTIKADTLLLTRLPNGKLRIEFDDPNPNRPGARPP
jgi:hypothetical protein